MIDLKFNYPSIPAEAEVMQHFFANFPPDFSKFLPLPSYQGVPENLALVREWLKLPAGIFPGVADLVTCNSGNHAISCLLQILRAKHSRIIVEPFTYPAFKALALQNGYQLHTSEFDEEGLTPEGLEQTLEKTGARLVYLQPTIHNPTCSIMSEERRRNIAEIARRRNILLLEDDAYWFLHPDTPTRLVDLAPENTIHIFSLSKPFNPLVKTVYVILPKAYTPALVDAIRFSSSGNSSLLTGLASYLLQGEALNTIIAQKQAMARERQELLLPKLAGLRYKTYPTSFHVWVELPKEVKSPDITTKLAAQNISVPSGVEFASVNPKAGERYLRIALGAEENMATVAMALQTLTELIRSN